MLKKVYSTYKVHPKEIKKKSKGGNKTPNKAVRNHQRRKGEEFILNTLGVNPNHFS